VQTATSSEAQQNQIKENIIKRNKVNFFIGGILKK
jgi:hypothetical protein